MFKRTQKDIEDDIKENRVRLEKLFMERTMYPEGKYFKELNTENPRLYYVTKVYTADTEHLHNERMDYLELQLGSIVRVAEHKRESLKIFNYQYYKEITKKDWDEAVGTLKELLTF